MNESGIYPMTNKILVKPDEEVKKKESVIEIPDSAKDRFKIGQTVGTVVAVGATAFLEEKRLFGIPPREFGVEPGARVLFSKFAGSELTGKDGQKYRMIYDTDVVARVEPEVRMEIGQ